MTYARETPSPYHSGRTEVYYVTTAVLCDPCGEERWGTGDEGFEKRYNDPERWVWHPYQDERPCLRCGRRADGR